MDFSDADGLLEHLIHRSTGPSDKRIAFVVGSGLTGDVIPGVDAYVKAMRASLEEEMARLGRSSRILENFDRSVSGPVPSYKYQQAASFLQHNRGQEWLNKVIRLGVLRACKSNATTGMNSDEMERLVKDEAFLEQLESSGQWELSEGADAFGRLLTLIPAERKGPVITTNFDPLIEIAVAKAGGQCATQWMESDGRILDSGRHNAIDVIHMHGYWRLGDTLHTQSQLGRNRPRLRASIRGKLQDHYVVVCGYGGWRDAFTKSLMARLREDDCLGMVVSWAWYTEITQTDFRDGIKSQLAKIPCVFHYGGVDVNKFFPDVLASLP